jgi:hypothetical protein
MVEPTPGGIIMRGITLLVGFVAIVLATAPTIVLIGRDVHRPADVDWQPVQVAAVVAVAVFLACYRLRAVASRRYVEASIRRDRAGWSPAFACTFAAWLPVVVAGGMAFATLLVAQTAGGPIEEGSYRANMAATPLPLLFLFATLMLFGVAGHDAWSFRRRHELPALEEAGVARAAPPVELDKKAAVRLRTRMWLHATVIDALFVAGGLLPKLLPGGEAPTENELATAGFSVIGGPGVVSFVLLVLMLAFWPARASALQALFRRSSLAAIGLVCAGLLLDSAELEIPGAIVGLSGVLLASATCLNIMDRGSQPWLGLVFLAASYVLGYLTSPDGDSALPGGAAGWTVAVLAAGYALYQGRDHWRAWTRLVPVQDEVSPPR